MCILIHHKPDTNFKLGHLEDFFQKNSDGFGALVKQPGGVKVIKTVGNLDEIHELYNNEVKGYEAVIHFRMKTHGDIDLFNCHPYQVTDNLWMAHNGILSTGNKEDISKSDTWHYIENFLKPLLTRDPGLIHEPAFQKMLESHIGYSNKFGFMDGDGNVVIINRSAGVEHLGAWLSNTYAWSPMKWGYHTSYYTGSSYASKDAEVRRNSLYSGMYGSDYWDYESYKSKSSPQLTKKEKKKAKKQAALSLADSPVDHIGRLSTESLGRIIRSCFNEMERNQVSGVTDWVIAHPMKAMHLIHEFYSGMWTPEEISEMVNSDPDEAAAVISEAWDEYRDDMYAIGGIPFTLEDETLWNQQSLAEE